MEEYKLGDLVLIPARIVGKQEYLNGGRYLLAEPTSITDIEDEGVFSYTPENIKGHYEENEEES